MFANFKAFEYTLKIFFLELLEWLIVRLGQTSKIGHEIFSLRGESSVNPWNFLTPQKCFPMVYTYMYRATQKI